MIMLFESKKIKQILAVLLCVLMLCTGCADNGGQIEEPLYSSITMEDAKTVEEAIKLLDIAQKAGVKICLRMP